MTKYVYSPVYQTLYAIVKDNIINSINIPVADIPLVIQSLVDQNNLVNQQKEPNNDFNL